MKVDFELKGTAELERLLRELGPKVARQAGRQALRAGARIIRDEAKRLVPVRTGTLRRAITVRARRVRRSDALGVSITVRQLTPPAGGRRKPVPANVYANFVEFGTAKAAAHPFLRPAFDAKSDDALREMIRVIRDAIERSRAA